MDTNINANYEVLNFEEMINYSVMVTLLLSLCIHLLF